MDWDVIVVGGGIGGAAAAVYLKEQGCRVGVLEKETLPRYKACAGGLPKQAQSLLPLSLDPVTEVVVTDVIYALRQEKRVEQSLYDQASLMVNRSEFDYYVLQHSGADVVENAQVIGIDETERGVRVRTRDGRQYDARYLIGADGANSRVARALGLRRDKTMGVAIEAEVEAPADTMAEYRHTALFQFGALRTGYVWIFPKHDHLSVGLGTFVGAADDLRGTLRREMLAMGIPLDGSPWRGHPLPIHVKAEPLNTGRCMLIGDAAGLVDAFLGEGIRYAILSARIAAETIASGSVSTYSARVKREISDGLRPARFAAQFFYRYTDFSFWCAANNAALTRLFLRLVAGTITYRDLVARLPLYLAQSLVARR